MTQKPLKSVWFNSAHSNMTFGKVCWQWGNCLPLQRKYCTQFGAAALGLAVEKNTALMDRSAQAWTQSHCTASLILKYSSQCSCLSINIYFNKRCTQSAHGALGTHMTFTVFGSFGLKMATNTKRYSINHLFMKSHCVMSFYVNAGGSWEADQDILKGYST